MVKSGKNIRMLITGGGTGGHLFPAVAAAQALKRRFPGSEVLFVGTRRKIDTTSLEQYGFSSCSVISYGLKGKKLIELVKALAILPLSFFQAFSHIKRFKPDVALGVGGYVTGPVMLAARVAGVATAIHEQNSIPGLANRKLGRVVDKICVSMPGSESYFPTEKTVFTGNPVRENILDLASKTDKHENSLLTLLVLGGSQGAHGINSLVVEAFTHADSRLREKVKLIHQTGQADYEWVAKNYRDCGLEAEVAPFFHDMRDIYQKSDFLVSRAGATTLTELAVLGKPAVLLPYPYAADNHQEKNARYYSDGGGALCYSEREMSGTRLQQIVSELSEDRERLGEMSAQMKRLGRPDAAEKLVEVCLELAERTK